MARTRQPKKAEKTEKTEKKTTTRKKDTPELVRGALTAYSNCTQAVSNVLPLPELSEGLGDMTTLLKNIRRAQSNVKQTRATISLLRNTQFRQIMFENVAKWEARLDEAWDEVLGD
jgi:hypothetical protein